MATLGLATKCLWNNQVFYPYERVGSRLQQLVAFANLSYCGLLILLPQNLLTIFYHFRNDVCVFIYILQTKVMGIYYRHCSPQLFSFNNMFWRSFHIAQMNHNLTDKHLTVFKCLQCYLFTYIISHLYEVQYMLVGQKECEFLILIDIDTLLSLEVVPNYTFTSKISYILCLSDTLRLHYIIKFFNSCL